MSLSLIVIQTNIKFLKVTVTRTNIWKKLTFIMHAAYLGRNKRRTVVCHQLVRFIWNYKILEFKELKETSQAQGREARAGKNKGFFEFSRVCESLKTMSKYFFIIFHH